MTWRFFLNLEVPTTNNNRDLTANECQMGITDYSSEESLKRKEEKKPFLKRESKYYEALPHG